MLRISSPLNAVSSAASVFSCPTTRMTAASTTAAFHIAMLVVLVSMVAVAVARWLFAVGISHLMFRSRCTKGLARMQDKNSENVSVKEMRNETNT